MVAMSLVQQLFGPWSDPQSQFIFLVTALATDRIFHVYLIVICRCLQPGMVFSHESSVRYLQLLVFRPQFPGQFVPKVNLHVVSHCWMQVSATWYETLSRICSLSPSTSSFQAPFSCSGSSEGESSLCISLLDAVVCNLV